MRDPAWHVLTGEYPPAPGGVSDYTFLVAGGLARAGAEVHVWTGPAEGPTPGQGGVAVHRDAGRWSPADLARLGAALGAARGPRRLLVQYTPNAWGYRGANLGFGRWLARRRAVGDEVWAMVHEPFYPWRLAEKPTRWVLAAAHRLMIRALLAASSRVFVSGPAIGTMVRPYDPPPRRALRCLPVPSNVPPVDDPAAVAAVRRRAAPGGGPVVGHFGTFPAPTAPRRLLEAALPPLLGGRGDAVALLLGRGSDGLAAELRARHPGLADRLIGAGGLGPAALSLHFQACDLLIQPYIDGVSTRRTTVMAGLEHGRAVATNSGHNTDPGWAESGCVALVDGVDMPALVAAAGALLADPAARDRLGARARAVYDERFAVGRTVEALLRP